MYGGSTRYRMCLGRWLPDRRYGQDISTSIHFLLRIPFSAYNETNIEDGVIILSLEQLTNAVISPETHYNIGYHAYARHLLEHKRQNLSFGADGFEG
ncbi:MAG: hypothetical protein IPP49_07025 [Saprospiraceae bacterium]|nr:hypothetical protein [Saprospiraceae bacterium]